MMWVVIIGVPFLVWAITTLLWWWEVGFGNWRTGQQWWRDRHGQT